MTGEATNPAPGVEETRRAALAAAGVGLPDADAASAFATRGLRGRFSALAPESVSFSDTGFTSRTRVGEERGSGETSAPRAPE